jgi:hypothetical protein
MSSAERREFVRLPAKLDLSYQVVPSSDVHDALTKDTSGGGIGLFTHEQLMPGSVLKVEVKFPARKDPVRFSGQVVWCGKLLHEPADGKAPQFEAGLHFVQISPEDQAYVLQFSGGRMHH